MLGNDSTSTPEVQFNLADLIANEIRAKSDLPEMATRYSKDICAEKGGDWPITERSTLSPDLPPSSLEPSPGKSSARWWTPPALPL